MLQPPIRTDPDATVAWNGTLSPSINTTHGVSDLIGQSSNERFQLSFEGGNGFVVVQPLEEGKDRYWDSIGEAALSNPWLGDIEPTCISRYW